MGIKRSVLKLFKGERLQSVDGIINREPAICNVAKEFSELKYVHGSFVIILRKGTVMNWFNTLAIRCVPLPPQTSGAMVMSPTPDTKALLEQRREVDEKNRSAITENGDTGNPSHP